MSQMMIYEVLNRAIWVATEIGAPILLIGGGVGLLMALVQAATQLSEPALTFIPSWPPSWSPCCSWGRGPWPSSPPSTSSCTR